MKKASRMFPLLPLISASHLFIAYSLQCFTIFLIFATDIGNYINKT